MLRYYKKGLVMGNQLENLIPAYGPQGLRAVLERLLESCKDRQFASQLHYILYKLANQESLIQTDMSQKPYLFWYADRDGRPITSGVKDVIRKFLQEKCGVNDLSSENLERYVKDVRSQDEMQKDFRTNPDSKRMLIIPIDRTITNILQNLKQHENRANWNLSPSERMLANILTHLQEPTHGVSKLGLFSEQLKRETKQPIAEVKAEKQNQPKQPK